MRRAFLFLFLSLPLLAELPAGTSRVVFSDAMTDASYLAATGDVLWVGSFFDDTLERVDLDGDGIRLVIPRTWAFTTSVAEGPDGALWVGSPDWIARVDPATNQFARWALGVGRGWNSVFSGPDGNIWLVQDRAVMRMRPDGVFLSNDDSGVSPTGAAFGSDGALYLSSPGKLTRMTASGERTEFAAAPREALLAGAGVLWSFDPVSRRKAGLTGFHDVVKMSQRGETLATYRIEMVPAGADPLGNLWLRAVSAEGDVVGQLTPSGVLTRFGPVPSMVSTECHPRYFGGFAFLSDGRVAMTDYYFNHPRTLLDPCLITERPDEVKNTITILDPRLAPVLSVEPLDWSKRRGSRR